MAITSIGVRFQFTRAPADELAHTMPFMAP
jgi:hypothetical protein